MESQKPKIEMYMKRPFGEKLNASFDFLKENWKPLLKFSTYLILPISLIQALSLNGLMGGVLNMSQIAKGGMMGTTSSLASMGGMLIVYYLGYILLYLVGTILLSSLVYGLIQTYNEREERLQGITLTALKPLLFRNMKRMLILILASIALMLFVCVLIGLLASFTYLTLILTIPILIAFCIPLMLLVPVYLFEKVTLIEAFKQTFRLGFATWGGVLLIYLVMGIIGGVLQGVTMTPWYIATLVKYFFTISDASDTTTVSIGYSFLLYLLGIIQTYGAYLSMIFSLIGLAYQYGHASEVVDSVTIESDIDNFDKLKR